MKTISNEIELEKVMNSIENDIRKSLEIFDDYNWEFAHKDGFRTRTLVFYETEWMFITHVLIKRIEKVVKKWERRYEGIIFSIGTWPCKHTQDGWLYTPAFEIGLGIKKDKQ